MSSEKIRIIENSALVRDNSRDCLKKVVHSSDQESAKSVVHAQSHANQIKPEFSGHERVKIPPISNSEKISVSGLEKKTSFMEHQERGSKGKETRHYQGERYQQQTYEHPAKQEASYGSLEAETTDMSIGGAAGNATLKIERHIIKPSQKGVAGKSAIKPSILESNHHIIKSGATLTPPKSSESRASSSGNASNRANSSSFVSRRIALIEHKNTDSLSEKAAMQAKRYGYKAGKYAVHTTAKASKKVIGIIKSSYARKITWNPSAIKKQLKNNAVALARTTKKVMVEEIRDFHGSDDLGIQTIAATKNAWFKTKNTYRTIQWTGKVFKKVAHKAKDTIQRTHNILRRSAAAVKKLFSNPLVIKGGLIIGLVVMIVALLITIATSITSIFPVISLKSEDKELAKTYDFITELDARLTNEIRSLSGNGIDEYHFYINGVSASREEVSIYTNADTILMFLDCKYEDYSFDNPILGLVGEHSVKEEIGILHHVLHHYDTNIWEEEIEHEEVNEDGTSDTEIEIRRHMDVNIVSTDVDSYLAENLDALLTEEQKEVYEALKEVGVYTSRKELANPFPDKEDFFLRERWGWKISSGNVIHNNGVDIIKPAGTDVCAMRSGLVSEIGTSSVRIKSEKNETVYDGLSSIVVSQGDTIAAGEKIGQIHGTSLHLEYFIENGFNTNPVFYLDGYAGYQPGSSAGMFNGSMTNLETFSGNKKLALAKAFPSGIPTTKAAMDQYMVTISVPCLNKSGNRVTRRVTCNPNIVPEVKEIFEEMADIGFIAYDVSCYSYRYKNNNSSQKSLSSHAYGLAFDINPNENAQYLMRNGRPYLNTGSLYQPGTNPYSITQEVANIWIRHGFGWGGTWNSQKDYMHFSLTGD